MTAVGIALEALERIAARGIVSFAFVEPRDGGARRLQRCPVCKALQAFEGGCANRECMTAIARKAIDDIRRAS